MAAVHTETDTDTRLPLEDWSTLAAGTGLVQWHT